MTKLRGIFFRGLFTFMPVALTIYILYAGILIVDNLLGSFLRAVLPSYIPGLGILATLGIIFALGLMLNNFVISGFLAGAERKLLTIPLIKAVYSPLRDLMDLFSKKGQSGTMKHVVLVDIGDTGMKAIGLVTRESFKDLEALQPHAIDKVAVYIPWSYGLGGITFLVSKSQVKQIDLPVEKAMSLALTAWVKASTEEPPHV